MSLYLGQILNPFPQYDSYFFTTIRKYHREKWYQYIYFRGIYLKTKKKWENDKISGLLYYVKHIC